MDTAKGTERISEEGAKEIKVDSVDYRSYPGEAEQPKKEKVGVVHLKHADHEKPATGGVISDAAAKVAEKIQSAKESLSGRPDGTSTQANK